MTVEISRASSNAGTSAYAMMYAQYQQNFGTNFNDQAAKSMGLEKIALQSLIEKNLFLPSILFELLFGFNIISSSEKF